MQINNNGYCKHCFTQSIHYGVENGSFTYYCIKCKKDIKKDEVLYREQVEEEIKRLQTKIKNFKSL